MNFKKAPDNELNLLFHRVVSENNLIEIGVYRVMFGWRVRSGFTGAGTCMLDWCAGANWDDVERLYSLCYAILSKREENRQCYDGVPPFSHVKPFFKDLSFLSIVGKQAGEFELIKLK